MEMSRRQALGLGGAGAAWLASGSLPALAEPQAAGGRALTVRDSANLAVSAAPDGRTLAIDVSGGIWTLPAGGGRARLITPLEHDATRPHFSPDGTRIVFQSFRDGIYDVWSVRPGGTGLTRHTDGPGYDVEPRFSPDGTRIALSSDRDHVSRIWVLHLASGTLTAVTEADQVHAAPAWSPDGARLVYVVGDTVLEVLDLSTGLRERPVTGEAVLAAPGFTPDGRLTYMRVEGPRTELIIGDTAVVTGEDLPPLPVTWLSGTEFAYTASGRLRRGGHPGQATEIPFSATLPVAVRDYRRRPRPLGSDTVRPVKGIASPVLSRDGGQMAFRALNALWILPIGGVARKVVEEGYLASDPDFAPDGRSLVYVSDRAGTANLWLLDLATGRSRRLTDLPNAQLRPRFSPDGSRIAYLDEAGATWVLDVADASVRQVLPALETPGRPSWSPDGGRLVLAALRPYSARTASGHNQVLTVDLATGEVRYQPVAPERSISTRGDDGPLWTSDGRYLVLGMESLAWRVPVDGTGTITGPPARLTGEVTDSVSVSGDGRTVLYLCNGTLRMVDIDGGAARSVPAGLSYRPARVSERVVLRAGALWDGAADRLRHRVDIVLDGDRIEAVVPTAARAAARVIDLSTLTVLPGLIDTHNHWHNRGLQWGDRQGRLWLAYGVTTSRSTGDPAYQMVENREALEAGTRVGPRYLGSGEALDGPRAFYGFMRTVMTDRQLDRELDRAVGLDYDLVKLYMRFPAALERRATERAHAAGIPVSSHYLYPAAHSGLDGMEHPGGGHRLGYSRTLSYGRYRMSADAVELLAATGMWVSSTTIFATELLAEDRSLVTDERTRVLFPDWEYRRLVAKADGATGPTAELFARITAGMVDALLHVHRAGGLVVFGTDAPLDDIGISAHQNLRAMVKYGFTPREALLTATRNAATALGYGTVLGTIAPGRLADLVAVEGDPLADIRAAAAVRAVMVGGTLRTVAELLAPFRQPTAAPTVSIGAALPSATPPAGQHRHRPQWTTHSCCK